MGRRAPRKKKPTKRELRELELFEALKDLVTDLGFTVEIARAIEGKGGDCVALGTRRIILARRLTPMQRNDLLVDILRRQELEDVFVRPDLRELIDGSDGTGGAAGAGA